MTEADKDNDKFEFIDEKTHHELETEFEKILKENQLDIKVLNFDNDVLCYCNL